jgi:hypothetical protein
MDIDENLNAYPKPTATTLVPDSVTLAWMSLMNSPGSVFWPSVTNTMMPFLFPSTCMTEKQLNNNQGLKLGCLQPDNNQGASKKLLAIGTLT